MSAAVRAAFEVALAAMSPAMPTAWENANFTPAIGSPYQRVFLLRAAPDNPEIGRFTIERGFFQVALFYPLGNGTADAEARAALIRSTFFRGASFTASGVTTVIERTPEILQGRAEDDRWVVPVRIRFFAHIGD